MIPASAMPLWTVMSRSMDEGADMIVVLGAEAVPVDKKLNLIGDQVAESAAGDFFSHQVSDCIDFRTSHQRMLQFDRGKENNFRRRAARGRRRSRAGDDRVIHRPIQ